MEPATAVGHQWERWGPLAARYSRPGPRRILSLDGGGIRGLITLGVLQRLEDELRRVHGEQLLLCDHFDLIGGTSTGAIIAAGLARGMPVAKITEFYRDFGRAAFSRNKLWKLQRSLYSDGPLALQLQDRFGVDSTLEPDQLRCLLTVVTRNATTDSAWPISSNPSARYNDPKRADCNLRIPLWQLVRASTAAPVYFPPEVVSWDGDDEDKTFVFVDGGTTPYNNPAFLLFRMATAPAYQLGWTSGERNLLVVSVGTGGAPVLGPSSEAPDSLFPISIVKTLQALMSQVSIDQDVICRTVGRCTYGAAIDRELRDLISYASDGASHPLTEDTGRAFLYARYDAELTDAGLERIGIEAGTFDPEPLRKLNAVDQIDALTTVGHALGQQLDLAQFGDLV